MFKGQGAIARLNQILNHSIKTVSIESQPSLENKIVLMNVNPNKIFSYWDFDKKTINDIKQAYHNNSIAYLGIFSDETEFEEKINFDINNERTMNYYFNNLKQGTSYQAALYMKEIELYIKSNVIQTPARPDEKVYNAGKEFCKI